MTKRIFISAAIATASTLSAINPATAASLYNILPFGDSITAGTHDVDPYPGAYRIKLWEKLNEKFKDINFVGTRQNGPTKDFDRDHSGYGGLTINQLAGDDEIKKDTYTYPGFTNVVDNIGKTTPNLILLMAGTNDLYEGDKAQTALSDLENLLTKVTTSFTNAEVLVSSIPSFDINGSKFDGIRDKPEQNQKKQQEKEEEAKANAGQVASFNNGISDIAKDKRFPNVTFVNVGGSLGTDDLVSDGIHPTQAGYEELGNEWFSEIKSIIPNTYLKKDNSGGGVKPGDNTDTGEDTGGGVKPGNNNGGVNAGGENPGGIPGNGSGTDIQSVPEPTSLVALLGFGALGAGATRRRKQMQQKTAS